MESFGYSLTGFLVGIMIGLTGIGGGSLMTPTLILFFDIPPAIAVGTDLLYASITKMSGIVVHHRRKTIVWENVKWLALGSIPAAVVCLFVLSQMKNIYADYQGLMRILLGIALIITALIVLIRKNGSSADQPAVTTRGLFLRKYRKWLTLLAGAIVGALVVLSSVGAGVIGTSGLMLLYPQLRAAQIIGTDLAHAVLLTTVSGLGHLHLGNIDFKLLFALLIGSLPGVWIGSHASIRLPEKLVQRTIALVLLFAGVRLVL